MQHGGSVYIMTNSTRTTLYIGVLPICGIVCFNTSSIFTRIVLRINTIVLFSFTMNILVV
jgi:hypothetical protein